MEWIHVWIGSYPLIENALTHIKNYFFNKNSGRNFVELIDFNFNFLDLFEISQMNDVSPRDIFFEFFFFWKKNGKEISELIDFFSPAHFNKKFFGYGKIVPGTKEIPFPARRLSLWSLK